MRLAKNFFTKEEEAQIIQAIQNAEEKTSAEIRVHIENFCFTNPLKRAEKVFIKNQMHLTKNRNGVLFYFAVISRKLAIIGDVGIYQKVPSELWNQLTQKLINALKQNHHKAETLCECILIIGNELARYFPPSADNPNELSNEISY